MTLPSPRVISSIWAKAAQMMKHREDHDAALQQHARPQRLLLDHVEVGVGDEVGSGRSFWAPARPAASDRHAAAP
jgi:hypothetical protein